MADKKPEVRVVPAAGLKTQYKRYLESNPDIADTVKLFNEYKREIPAKQLPAKMQDHVLKGNLKGIRECHLDNDVLLLYTHKKNTVRMLYICEHSDLYGRRARQLKSTITQISDALSVNDDD